MKQPDVPTPDSVISRISTKSPTRIKHLHLYSYLYFVRYKCSSILAVFKLLMFNRNCYIIQNDREIVFEELKMKWHGGFVAWFEVPTLPEFIWRCSRNTQPTVKISDMQPRCELWTSQIRCRHVLHLIWIHNRSCELTVIAAL
jgi:hypothetical protein